MIAPHVKTFVGFMQKIKKENPAWVKNNLENKTFAIEKFPPFFNHRICQSTISTAPIELFLVIGLVVSLSLSL